MLHQTTCPYTPEQNGAVERINRTLVEKARSMLNDVGLPKKFWVEAVSTAAYLVNRSPTRSLETTPEEAWSKETRFEAFTNTWISRNGSLFEVKTAEVFINEKKSFSRRM